MKTLRQQVLEHIGDSDMKTLSPYSDFATDVERLFDIASDQSIPGISAEIWLQQIRDMSKDRLLNYIAEYRKGLLNPFRGTSWEA